MTNQMVRFVAHRGLSVAYPENTHAAFNAAWAQDCDGIELDLQVTRDGHVVVIHDPDTLRTTGKKHLVSESDWGELQALNAANGCDSSFEQIPLLDDVIANIPAGKWVQIEIKHQIAQMQPVITALLGLRDDIRVQVISFDVEKLTLAQQVTAHLSHIDCLLLIEQSHTLPDPCQYAVDHGFAGLDIPYQLADEVFLQHAKQHELMIGTWTVNDEQIAADLISRGVQFIAGDIVDQFLHLRQQR